MNRSAGMSAHNRRNPQMQPINNPSIVVQYTSSPPRSILASVAGLSFPSLSPASAAAGKADSAAAYSATFICRLYLLTAT